jgi:integrase
MRARLFQDHRQKKKLGDESPWSVGWLDPDGKRRSRRIGGKSLVEKYRRKVEGQLAAGIYKQESRKSWADFRAEYETKIAAGMEPETRTETLRTLDHFERIARPGKVAAVKTQMIDDFVAKRRTEPGRKRGDTVSPATVNKDLRHLKAVLRVAHDWGYLPVVPKARMLKEPKKLPRYVTPEHFAAIYRACDQADRPARQRYAPADWWRALVTLAYMTGWRVSERLALRWDDVSLENGEAITWHEDNKGRRDERVPLHPVVVEHLQRILDFGDRVFPWPHHERTLWSDFARIQTAAGIHLPCRERHEHTDACHLYGFHDLRRAFATLNAPRLSADALQALMRHKSYLTTQRYINMARQLNQAVQGLHVPEVLRKAN